VAAAVFGSLTAAAFLQGRSAGIVASLHSIAAKQAIA
jgi:hypothetical protein